MLQKNEKKVVCLANDENKIRDELLLNYLKNNVIRNELGITDYLFDREVPEDNTNGRCDIKIQTQNTFINTNDYYIIECKRLDDKKPRGNSGLNAKYIQNGIMRFVNKQYSTNNSLNGMIGFVVKPFDIPKNVNDINYLLMKKFQKSNTQNFMTNKKSFQKFRYLYLSKHKINKSNKIIQLYHLMFDFSDNILT